MATNAKTAVEAKEKASKATKTDSPVTKQVNPQVNTKTNKTQDAPVMFRTETKVELPEVKAVLKAGLQFGHEVKRWNPKYEDFIFGKKNNIHIIDISKTMPLLKTAGDFLAAAIARGPVLFLGTKRQAADIVTEAAQTAGAHYITNRWAGGLMTNFPQIQKSLNRLNDYEKQFEEGVKDRTKYEVAQMRKDWERLNRLYAGIKQLKQRPVAVFVVDPEFESGAIRECNYLDIPVVGMVDTNADPTIIDFPIPGNDDALGSINLVVDYLVKRMQEVESPYKVTHKLKDYAKTEVVIKKTEVATESESELTTARKAVQPVVEAPKAVAPVVKKETKLTKTQDKKQAAKPSKAKKEDNAADIQGGILGRFQEEKNKAKIKK